MKLLVKWLFAISIIMTIVGYFLQTILIPIQDFDQITKEELKRIQLEVAINYPLGTTLLYLGIFLFLVTGEYLVFTFIQSKNVKI
ncbi:hypothetical protein [uncultured Vagococcus sp.]|uniref:hypothetical protein n=1 Tax=uncultured Vagococcus sp. TaxID=189676 RepID=UPI00258E8855|nr:hypothetical protein [uncultured Vagococcus sp.]